MFAPDPSPRTSHLLPLLLHNLTWLAAGGFAVTVRGYRHTKPMFTSQRDRKDAREAEREALRLEKRHLRDLRWAVERSRIETSDWADLLTLQAAHGKEGPLQLWRELIPYWRDCQRVNGGADIPAELFPQATGIFPRATAGDAPANRQKAGKGAPRKRRSDAGKAQPSRKRSS